MITVQLRRALLSGAPLILMFVSMAHAADLPDPPEMAQELLPHCTWDWNKVDMGRFEIRDGLVCAGRQCIDEAFYDPLSLEACGMDDDLAEDMLWARIARPNRRDPRLVELQAALTELANREKARIRESRDALDRCLRGGDEAALLTSRQANSVVEQCDFALSAVESARLSDSETDLLTQARAKVAARLQAAGDRP